MKNDQVWKFFILQAIYKTYMLLSKNKGLRGMDEMNDNIYMFYNGKKWVCNMWNKRLNKSKKLNN